MRLRANITVLPAHYVSGSLPTALLPVPNIDSTFPMTFPTCLPACHRYYAGLDGSADTCAAYY